VQVEVEVDLAVFLTHRRAVLVGSVVAETELPGTILVGMDLNILAVVEEGLLQLFRVEAVVRAL
jgi:hypothetical protein